MDPLSSIISAYVSGVCFSALIWILGLFSSSIKNVIGILWELHWLCRLVLVIYLFHKISSANTEAWKVFPLSNILFNFFFSILNFHCRRNSHSWLSLLRCTFKIILIGHFLQFLSWDVNDDIQKSCWFLCPSTFLEVSFRSKSVLVPFIVHFKYNIMSSGNSNNLISSFLSHIPFISFSCLVELDKNLSTKLSEQERPGTLVSFWILKEMFSDFYHLVKIPGSMFIKHSLYYAE